MRNGIVVAIPVTARNNKGAEIARHHASYTLHICNLIVDCMLHFCVMMLNSKKHYCSVVPVLPPSHLQGLTSPWPVIILPTLCINFRFRFQCRISIILWADDKEIEYSYEICDPILPNPTASLQLRNDSILHY